MVKARLAHNSKTIPRADLLDLLEGRTNLTHTPLRRKRFFSHVEGYGPI